MTEVLIVIFPLLVLVLGLVQVALLLAADLLVRRAAAVTARAAVVVLPYGDAKLPDDAPLPPDPRPHGFVPYGEDAPADDRATLAVYRASPRHALVRRAAAWAMAPAGPDVGTFLLSIDQVEPAVFERALAAAREALEPLAGTTDEALLGLAVGAAARGAGDDVATALGAAAPIDDAPGPWPRSLALALHKYGYAAFATAVTFPDGERGYRASFAPRGPVRVRVTYLFRCGVPIANRIACRRFRDLPERARLELAYGDPAIAGGDLPGRFLALTAEAELPNQGA